MTNHLYKEDQGSYCGTPNASEIEGRLECTLGEFFTEKILKEFEAIYCKRCVRIWKKNILKGSKD